MKKLFLLLLLVFVTMSCKSAYDNMVVNASGIAKNYQGEPVLVGSDGSQYYLEDMDSWPESDLGNTVTVTGKLTRKGSKRIIREAKVIGDEN